MRTEPTKFRPGALIDACDPPRKMTMDLAENADWAGNGDAVPGYAAAMASAADKAAMMQHLIQLSGDDSE
jgi:hypothetical protein